MKKTSTASSPSTMESRLSVRLRWRRCAAHDRRVGRRSRLPALVARVDDRVADERDRPGHERRALLGLGGAVAARSSSAASSDGSTVTRSAPDDRRREPARSSAPHRALGGRLGDDEVVDRRFERAQDARGILVAQDADHRGDVVEREVLGERRGERCGAVRIVRRIHQHGRLVADRPGAARATSRWRGPRRAHPG